MSCPMQRLLRRGSVVCSIVHAIIHSQSGKGAIPHRAWTNGIAQYQSSRQLTLSQAVPSKPISTSLVLVMSMKVQSLDVFSQYSVFHE